MNKLCLLLNSFFNRIKKSIKSASIYKKLEITYFSFKVDVKRLTEFLHPFSIVMNDLKFIIFGMIAGYILFTAPDQAQDNFVNMFGETRISKIDKLYVITFWIAICFWSFQAWAGARTIMYLRNYEQFYSMVGAAKWEKFTRRILFMQKYFPRILTLLPPLIVMMAINNAICFNWLAASYLITGVVIFIFLTYRKQLTGNTQKESDARFSIGIRKLTGTYKIFIGLTLIILIGYFFAIIFSISFSQSLQTMLITAISIIFWTYAFMWLEYFTWKMRTSLLVGLLIVFYFFSMINNNHEVRTLGEFPYQTASSLPDIQDHYTHFLKQGPAKDTIYLVATQGGGIRASYWTTLVLMEMINQNPNLYQKLYAISGSSGGTVGAAVYIAHLKKFGIDSVAQINNNIRNFYENDFLAPLTGAYLVPDLLQKFLPIKWTRVDRARYLEKSWEVADSSGLFATSFANLFRESTQGFNLPLLMVNSTWIETGQRTVISPVKIANCAPLMRESFSLMDNWGGDIRLSTAVGMGARFPLLTPGAVVKKDKCNVLGTFGDGGYVENTGIATAIDLKDMIKLRHHASADSLQPLIIHLIYIENGDTSGKINPEPLDELYETKTVINGFYNSWSGQDKTTASKVTSYVREYLDLNKDNDEPVSLAFTRISLPRQTDTILPLGWVLSTPAKEYMLSKVRPVVKKAFGNTIHQ